MVVKAELYLPKEGQSPNIVIKKNKVCTQNCRWGKKGKVRDREGKTNAAMSPATQHNKVAICSMLQNKVNNHNTTGRQVGIIRRLPP